MGEGLAGEAAPLRVGWRAKGGGLDGEAAPLTVGWRAGWQGWMAGRRGLATGSGVEGQLDLPSPLKYP